MKLYRCFTEGDCDLAEINPLILRPDGGVHALDAKVSLDNNAAFRHPEWDEYRATEELDEREQMAREHDLQYIGLDGTVGIIANGAGLAMSTLDVVNQVGGTAANFLDIGGGANADVMAAALEVINFDQKVKSIFINIFGGITRGEEVAKGIVEALGPSRPACADRDPPRRHQRRGGPQDPGQRRHPEVEADVGTHHAGCGSRCGRPSPTGATDMAIFVNADTKVVVQGLTGGQGKYHGLRNKAYGTQGRRRRHPRQGRAGRRGHAGLRHGRRGGCRDRRDGVVHRGPAEGRVGGDPRSRRGRHRVHRLHHRGHSGAGRGQGLQHARARLSRTPGCSARTAPASSAPGKCNIGITAGEIAQLPSAAGPNVGIVSRSGTLTYQALYELKQRGIGVSTCVGIGGDPVPGTNFIDCLSEFQADPETHAIIMIGEIGGSAEEEAAAFIESSVTKPMSAYIAGVTAPAGKKMGHAGAIVSGGKGTAQGKMDALRAAGVHVGLNPTEAGELMADILNHLEVAPGTRHHPRRTPAPQICGGLLTSV